MPDKKQFKTRGKTGLSEKSKESLLTVTQILDRWAAKHAITKNTSETIPHDTDHQATGRGADEVAIVNLDAVAPIQNKRRIF